MDQEISEKIRSRLLQQKSLDRIRLELINEGHQQGQVDAAVEHFRRVHQVKHTRARGFIAKELFDRIGYGLGSSQFLTILFSLIGANYLLISLLGAAKTVVTYIVTLVMDEYSKIRAVRKRMVGYSGIIFGLSFIVIAHSVFFRSTPLFMAGVLISAAAVVPYGNICRKMMKGVIDRKWDLTGKLSYLGIFVTGISIAFSAFLLDTFPLGGETITLELPGNTITLTLYGYMLTLCGAAVSLIISGYILYFLYWRQIEEKVGMDLKEEMHLCVSGAKTLFTKILRQPDLLTITLSGMAIALVQGIGNLFYGIFIFTAMHDSGFGGWMNVAAVFIMGMLATIISPSITRMISKEYGKVPMLAFGSALMAIMPLSYCFHPTIVSISMGTIAGIIGSSINGVATGLIIKDLLPDEERKTYFQMNSMLSIIPAIVLIPAGGLIASLWGLKALFLALGAAIILFVIPLHFSILLRNNKNPTGRI